MFQLVNGAIRFEFDTAFDSEGNDLSTFGYVINFLEGLHSVNDGRKFSDESFGPMFHDVFGKALDSIKVVRRG